jgi:L-fucose mutarotase/ribose pyranase (RbsD/FucU family)
MIHFSFELFENRIPNNKDIFEVCLALSILSNDRKNFTLNNVNRELKAIHSNLKIEIRRGSPLGFYDNKCYPLPQIQTDRRVERVENNSTTTTNNTVVEVKKVSEPVSNGIISNNTVEDNKKDNTTTNNTNEVVQQQSIKSSRMKKKN